MTLQHTRTGGPTVAGIAEPVRRHVRFPLRQGHCR